jgi:hypothetical protein
MTLRELTELGFRLETETSDPLQTMEGVYIGDYLSIVMKSAQSGNLLVTSQATMNAVAVAVLLDLPAILFVETNNIPSAVLERATAEGVALLSTTGTAFAAAKRIWERSLS